VKSAFAGIALILLTAVSTSMAAAQTVPSITQHPFTVVFSLGSQRLAARVLHMAGAMQALPGIPNYHWRTEPIQIVLAPSEPAFQAVTGGQIPEWGAGVAIPARSMIVLPAWGSVERGGPLDYGRVLRHEIAHIALHRAVRPSLPPRWFDEGYASWAANEVDRSSAWMLRLAFFTGSAPPLDSLTLDWPRGAAEARLAYLLSGTVIEFLVDESGERGLNRLLERWRLTGNFEQSLIATYGVNTGTLETQWVRYVKKKYGWTVIVSQSAIFGGFAGAIVFVLYFIRRRRDRAKLKKLRAEEMPDAPAFWSEAGVEIIAHRGYSARAPENTIAAFELALEKGATSLEFDIHSSYDGVPIVIHDSTLERTTNASGKVGRRKWSTLQKLDAGRWFGSEFSGEPLPSLEDVLKAVQGKANRLYIELKEKAFTPKQIARVLELLAAYNFQERCVLMSFDWNQLEAIRSQHADIQIAFLADAEEVYLLALEQARADRNALVDCNYKLLLANPELARFAHHLRLDLVVYTVNDIVAAAALARQGVRRLTTNEVERLLQWAAGRDPQEAPES
jgi:glycerophosphoryl diester phosphodiesterase